MAQFPFGERHKKMGHSGNYGPVKIGRFALANAGKTITLTSAGVGHDKSEIIPGAGAATYWRVFKPFILANPGCKVQSWINYLGSHPITQCSHTVSTHLKYDVEHGYITLT